MSLTAREAEDRRFMAAALSLSRTHTGLTGTNPSVGCVIVKDGDIVGEAVTASAVGRMRKPRRWQLPAKGPRRHGLCHARTLLALRQDAALRQCAGCSRRCPRRRLPR